MTTNDDKHPAPEMPAAQGGQDKDEKVLSTKSDAQQKSKEAPSAETAGSKTDSTEIKDEEADKNEGFENNAALNTSEKKDEPKAKRDSSIRVPKAAISGVVIAAVLVCAGVGFFAWHEQPSFCSAICHTPMDPYLPTYEATPGESAVDKWGNEVEDASGMLAAVHAQVDKSCLDCHEPELGEQINEGLEWVSGNYEAPLLERTSTQLLEARNIDNSDEFCMNSSCHPYTREDLIKKTEWMGEINPHYPQHGDQNCTTCHKAHRESVMYCTQCHAEAVVPDGWITYTENVELENKFSDGEE